MSVSFLQTFSVCLILFSVASACLYIPLQVSHTQPEEITFRVHQKLKVGVLQPAAVSVYEYNQQYSNRKSQRYL